MSTPAYQRVLLKLSGEALMGDGDYGIDPAIIARLAREINEISQLGVQIAIVIGGGNIFRGAGLAEAGMNRVAGDHMGMLATVMNSLALQDALESIGCYARVMSALRINQVCEDYIQRRAVRHLEKGRVVIFAGGTGNPYFSTDTAAALRAIEMEADVVIHATKVAGVFTADPETDPSATFIPNITFREVVAQELAVMDAPAVSLCKENGLPIIVLDLEERGSISAAIRGEKVGTLVS